MNIRELLKKNDFIRCIGKRIMILKSFAHDYHDFKNNYIEKSVKKQEFEYSIMLLVHSIEKGMCMPKPRPFGFEKVKSLIVMLNDTKDKSSFEYLLGVSILHAWKDYFIANGWDTIGKFSELKTEISNFPSNSLGAGTKEIRFFSNELDDSFRRLLFSRHSVRDFKPDKINKTDLELAIKAFIMTPTACNRQMCRLYLVEDAVIKKELKDRIIGISGFVIENTNFFIITYDLAAFAYSGERNQGMFNAGLCTMNFINGLHAKGIGSCCLQWSNKYEEDLKVRKILKLKESERIAVVVAAGYYKEKSVVPSSVRRGENDVFSIL